MCFGFVIFLISFYSSTRKKLILPPLENEEIPQILDSNEDSSKSQSDDLQALVTLHRSFISISFFQKNFHNYNTFLTRIQCSPRKVSNERCCRRITIACILHFAMLAASQPITSIQKWVFFAIV